jgi:hypothetical protein
MLSPLALSAATTVIMLIVAAWEAISLGSRKDATKPHSEATSA